MRDSPVSPVAGESEQDSIREVPFHSMNTRKVRGAKQALYLVRNAEKVSNFCNDVIGDICGIVSGATIAVLVATLIMNYNNNPLYLSIILTAFVASITVGGKGLGKTYAIANSNQIVYSAALVMCFFQKRDKENRSERRGRA